MEISCWSLDCVGVKVTESNIIQQKIWLSRREEILLSRSPDSTSTWLILTSADLRGFGNGCRVLAWRSFRLSLCLRAAPPTPQLTGGRTWQDSWPLQCSTSSDSPPDSPAHLPLTEPMTLLLTSSLVPHLCVADFTHSLVLNIRLWANPFPNLWLLVLIRPWGSQLLLRWLNGWLTLVLHWYFYRNVTDFCVLNLSRNYISLPSHGLRSS